MNKVIIFSAPSGSGKSTVVSHLLKERPELAFSVSATTRAPRGKEKDGEHYHFLSEEEFKRRIAADEFVEYEQVYSGSYYGTLKSEVECIWELGKVVVFDVDVVGGVHLKEIFGDKALDIFIRPPSLQVLEERLRERGTDSEEKIIERVEKAENELDYEPKFSRVLVNDKLGETLKKAEQLVDEFIAS